MKRTATYTYILDDTEQFTWTKGAGLHPGHSFAVDMIELTQRSHRASIYLRGPWLDPAPEVEPGTPGEKVGWDFLDLDQPSDVARLWDLPAGIHEQLAVDGLEVEP